MAQWSWRILVAVGSRALFVAIFVAMPLVVIPVVLALILAATLDPLVLRLMRARPLAGGAAAIAVGGGFLAIVGVLAITVYALDRPGAATHATAVSGADDGEQRRRRSARPGRAARSTGGGNVVRT